MKENYKNLQKFLLDKETTLKEVCDKSGGLFPYRRTYERLTRNKNMEYGEFTALVKSVDKSAKVVNNKGVWVIVYKTK